MKRHLPGVLTVLPISLLCGTILQAQSQLALSSGSAPTGAAVSLNLTLSSPAGSEPAQIQWTFNYPATSISSFNVTAGPALTAAAKTLDCQAGTTTYSCTATGINNNLIGNGVVATVAVTMSSAGSAAIGISGQQASSAAGDAQVVNATGGTATSINSSSVLSGISCSPSTLAPAGVASCTATLSAPAPASMSVALSATGSLTVPASVSIPANASNATFNATAGSFSTDQTGVVTGTLIGVTKTASIALVAPVTPAALACATTALSASSSTTCTVTLSKAAPSGGSTVTLSSSLSSALTVPASVTVAASATTATFTATAAAVTSDQAPVITATLNGASRTVTLTVSASPITVSALQCASTTLASAGTTTCTVTLSRAPSAAITVTLASSITTALTVPASVSVAASATTATFNATAAAVTSDQAPIITATLGSSSRTVTITVSASVISISSLQCASTVIALGASTTCTVTLSRAPAASTVVTLSSSLPTVLSVPASVTVAASATTATFTASASNVVSDQAPVITSTLGSSSRSVTFNINATAISVSSLQCAATTLTAATSTTCTVTLSRTTTAAASITLSSSLLSALTVPASVTVNAGAATATFTATAALVTALQTPILTSSYNGSSRTVTLTITAPVILTSLACTNTVLLPSTSTSCTAALSGAAPSGGLAVALSASPSSSFSLPASVTAAAGATSINFQLNTTAFTTAQSGSVSASLNGSSLTANLSLIASLPAPYSLTCTVSTLTPNTSTQCTVRLNSISPDGGTPVALTSSVPTVLTVPSSVTVAAGTNSKTFQASAGAIASVQNASIRAQVAQTAVTFPIALSPSASSLSTFTCSPVSLAPGSGGTCTVTLTSAAASAALVALRTSNTSLIIPASVTVSAGSSSATFPFSLAPAMSGWAILSANLSSVTKSVTITATAARSVVRSTSDLRLRCDQRQIAPGRRVVCEVQQTPSEEAVAAEPADIAVSTTSGNLKAPTSVRGRTPRSSVRFELTAAEDSPMENVAIEVRSGSASASESLLIVPDGSLHLRLPRNLSARPGSPVQFTASASDDQGLPVSVAASGQPSGSVFDAQSGVFEWTPAEDNLGTHTIEFTATNSLGFTTTRSIDIDVVAARPALSRLRNGAGPGALAACTPGSLATLLGNSLAGDSGAASRVLVNGVDATVVRATNRQIDFVCPALAPGASMAISVIAGRETSNELQTVMQESAPGLLTIDGSGSGQGLVAHARGLATLPRFGQEGMPAIAGEAITLLATGINCNEISSGLKPLLYLGHDLQSVTLLRPSAYPGVCEVHSVIPQGVSGNEVALVLQLVREDGSTVKSNAILIAIE